MKKHILMLPGIKISKIDITSQIHISTQDGPSKIMNEAYCS
jgi:hypothetical protein